MTKPTEQNKSIQETQFSIKTAEGKKFLAKRGEPIVLSARNSGLVFQYSCLTGRCGACAAELISGEVEELNPQVSLTEDDRIGGKILTCCCGPLSDLEIDAVDLSALSAIKQKLVPAKVKEIELLKGDVVEVILRFPESQKIDFLPGQYVDVSYRNYVRSYSIASMPEDKEMRLIIKRIPGGKMSKYWFEHAKVDDILRVEGPKGTFFVRDSSVPLIFVATGTGIAPIMSILNSLDQDNSAPKSMIKVFWGGRGDDAFYWMPSFENLDVDIVKVNSQPSVHWKGEIAYVQDAVLREYRDLFDYSVYACGSKSMIEQAKTLFINAGLKESRFFFDAFVASNKS